MTTVYVMLPTGSRAEVEVARAALAKDDVRLTMCTGRVHQPGQRLNGDVVVIGPASAAIEADAVGTVTRYVDMEAMVAAQKPPAEPSKKAEESEPEPAPEVKEQAQPAARKASVPDDLGKMSRSELVQYGARTWPGRRRWATMGTDDLITAIQELSA